MLYNACFKLYTNSQHAPLKENDVFSGFEDGLQTARFCKLYEDLEAIWGHLRIVADRSSVPRVDVYEWIKEHGLIFVEIRVSPDKHKCYCQNRMLNELWSMGLLIHGFHPRLRSKHRPDSSRGMQEEVAEQRLELIIILTQTRMLRALA